MSRQLSSPITVAVVCVQTQNGGPPVYIDVRKQWISRLVYQALSTTGLVRGNESAGVVMYHEICAGAQHRFLTEIIDNGPVKWARLTDVSTYIDNNSMATWIGGTNNVFDAGNLQTILRYEKSTFVAPPPVVWTENFGALMWCYGQSKSRPFLLLPPKHRGAAIAVPIVPEPNMYAVMAPRCCGECADKTFTCAETQIANIVGNFEVASFISTAAGTTWYVTSKQVHQIAAQVDNPSVIKELLQESWPPFTAWWPLTELLSADPSTSALEHVRDRLVWENLRDQHCADEQVLAQTRILLDLHEPSLPISGAGKN